jgi:fused signal recognition particle receptor
MANIFTKWKNGLQKSSKAALGQIAALLGTSEITPDTWDELEEILIQADLGVETTEWVLNRLEKRVDQDGLLKAKELRNVLREELRALLINPAPLDLDQKPTVILIVGVNGSGKTTSIAKLGLRFKAQGKNVLLGAADTYRAAAVDQLEIWAERLGLPIISGLQGGDSAAVAYDSIQAGKARSADVVLIDTAGRLHTRFNLMEELKKVHRVVSKATPGAPHYVWLVMDATTGQNALQQARAFKDAVHVSGVILAKLDTSARGGMAFSITHDLGLPIIFAGLGEKPEDLEPFDPDAFVDGILSYSPIE